MSRSDRTRNNLAQAYADNAYALSVHDGDPGATGANDTGITHQVLSWPDPPAAGVIVSDAVSFAIPASTDMKYIGLWDSGGHFLDSFVNNISFGSATTYLVAISYTQG